MEIVPVPVPAVVVKPVGSALLNAVADAPEQIKVPPLKVIFFVPAAVITPVTSVCVSVYPAKLSVPLVNVRRNCVPALASVVVIPAPLIVNVPIGMPVYVRVPSPTIVKLADVYDPPLASVKPWQFALPIDVLDPVKFICLNEPVNVGKLAPDCRLRLSLLEAVAPAVPPKLNVLVVDIPTPILDVPVNVKFVASAIDKTVDAAVAVVRTIEPVVPKAIALVFELLELNIPVLNAKLFRSNVPFDKAVDTVVFVVSASCKVTVPLGQSIAIP
jgi:hypothetical protein